MGTPIALLALVGIIIALLLVWWWFSVINSFRDKNNAIAERCKAEVELLQNQADLTSMQKEEVRIRINAMQNDEFWKTYERKLEHPEAFEPNQPNL